MGTQVIIETEAGEIHVALEDEQAPGTVANFLRYVDAGLYDGGRFHRVVRLDNQPNDEIRIEVIQGGVNLERMTENGAPIPLERTSVTGLRHLDGTISMARFRPDSAVSDFFICIGDQ
ncbi:MAG: peptidylprolyl isomerase, partial [Chloroflexia bacterium]|nr:peptidylprolyl isomerase [Chloroflexia bacterium]